MMNLAAAVMLFPHPLSPTSAVVRPARRRRSTSPTTSSRRPPSAIKPTPSPDAVKTASVPPLTRRFKSGAFIPWTLKHGPPVF